MSTATDQAAYDALVQKSLATQAQNILDQQALSAKVAKQTQADQQASNDAYLKANPPQAPVNKSQTTTTQATTQAVPLAPANINNASNHTGNTLIQVLYFTLFFAIALAIQTRTIHKNKDKREFSKWAAFKYAYATYGRMALIVFYSGFLLNLFSTKLVIPYLALVVAGGIYWFKFRNRKAQATSKIPINIEPGVVLGASNNQLIIKGAQESGHVLVAGGSGKGKSQAVTIPALLNWKGSALVIDIKRELYAYTHNVQEKKGKVIVFDPEQNGHQYNPILECSTVDGCQFLARTLIPTPPKADPFWTGNAQSILAAACFEGHKNGQILPQIAERILMTESAKLVEELCNSKYREAVLLCSAVKGTPEKTLGGIFTELKGKLITIATDPNLRQALSGSEWTPATLEESATIYMRVSERQVENYKQVWSLIVVQILRYLAGRSEQQDPPVLLLLDELARLGKVEGYSESLPTLRSKNVTIVSAIQSLAQLQEHYGKEVTRTIMDNKAYKLVLSASDNETQKVFSDLAGKSEIKKRGVNYSMSGGGVNEHFQWEEKFRPENFAYLKKPIYYPPDSPAREVDKVYWMNIPALFKLQKESGGPTNFMDKEEIEKHSQFHRPASVINLIKKEEAEIPVEIDENIEELLL